MFIKILGIIDFSLGLILIFGMNLKIPIILLSLFGGILIIKAMLGLLRDFASWIDFLSGIVFCLTSLFLFPPLIYAILGILLLQKGFFSFISD